jgi:hypothetical protein
MGLELNVSPRNCQQIEVDMQTNRSCLFPTVPKPGQRIQDP